MVKKKKTRRFKKKVELVVEDLSKYTLPKKEAVKEPEVSEPVFTNEESISFFRGNRGIIWALFIFLVFCAGVTASFLVYRSAVAEPTDSTEVSRDISTPKPTIAPEVVNSEYNLVVLNGSGVAGEAARLGDLLDAGGFTVLDIGNAESSVPKTIISKTDKVPDSYIKSLSEFLSKYYVLAPEVEINSSQSSDITITIGKEIKE